MKTLILSFLLFFDFNLAAREASEEVRKTVSHFVENIVNGNSKFFFNNGIVREGSIIGDYQVFEITEDKNNLVNVKVQYFVVGTFRNNERSLSPIKKMHKKIKTETASYSFLKKEKTYILQEITPRRPFVLKSKL